MKNLNEPRKRESEVIPFEHHATRQESTGSLLPARQGQELRDRWTTFTAQRNNLEKQWKRGEEASTEDLRVALQQYRSFFDRLLSI